MAEIQVREHPVSSAVFSGRVVAVGIIIGTSFLNRHGTEIRCAEQKVQVCTEVITIVMKRQGLKVQGKKSSDWTGARTKKLREVECTSEKVRREEACAHEKLTQVRLSKAINLGPYSQVKATVVTLSNRLVTLEPSTDLVSDYDVKMTKGIAEVAAEQHFVVFLKNFGAVEQSFPKGIKVACAMKSTLVLSSVEVAFGRYLVKFMNIVENEGLCNQEKHIKNTSQDCRKHKRKKEIK